MEKCGKMVMCCCWRCIGAYCLLNILSNLFLRCCLCLEPRPTREPFRNSLPNMLAVQWNFLPLSFLCSHSSRINFDGDSSIFSWLKADVYIAQVWVVYVLFIVRYWFCLQENKDCINWIFFSLCENNFWSFTFALNNVAASRKVLEEWGTTTLRIQPSSVVPFSWTWILT